MAFVAEDGTGKADSNSYTDVAYADNYFQERGITTWSGTPEQKQSYLIQGTDYIEVRWYGKFKSKPLITEPVPQALQWPRVGLGMPPNLLKACCEYALRAKVAPLAPDITTGAGGYAVSKLKEKVGPIETETEFAVTAGSSPSLIKPYPQADMLMKGLIVNSGNRVIR